MQNPVVSSTFLRTPLEKLMDPLMVLSYYLSMSNGLTYNGVGHFIIAKIFPVLFLFIVISSSPHHFIIHHKHHRLTNLTTLMLGIHTHSLTTTSTTPIGQRGFFSRYYMFPIDQRSDMLKNLGLRFYMSFP